MANIIKSLSKLISRCCVLLVLVTSGNLSAAEFDAKVVREIYDVKTAYGCAFSFSYVWLLLTVIASALDFQLIFLIFA